MATPNAQLRKIFQDLKAQFDNSQYVEIIPFDDDPPEKYEINYTILGLVQDKSGNIIETKDHSIFINIPFGYPHFPPSCTPKSSTFHPDFDQAAICIGEYWNKDRTLPDLIIHIGKMIAGEVYSTENVFNDAALAWYNKIANQLPFEKLDFSSAKEVEPEILTLDEEDLLSPDMDTLNEADFSSPNDFISETHELEDDEQISFPTPPQTSGKSSLNRVHLLIRQKRFYELSVFLKELPEEEQFEDRTEIEAKITALLEKAMQLQKEADEAEHLGNPQKALELFQKAAELVPDFPNIEESISRARNSVDLAGDDWSLDETSMAETDNQDSEKSGSRKRVAFFEETTKKSIRFLPILGGIIVIVLAIVFITPYFGAKSKLDKASRLYEQCLQLLENNQFSQARSECESAQAALKKIGLFKKNDRDLLGKQITRTLASDKMVQGLVGRVLFQGKFVRKTDMNRVLEFNKQKEEGDEFFDNSQWQKALDKFQEALKTAKPIHDSFEESLLREVENKIRIADINLTVDRGVSLLTRNEIEKSFEKFTTALASAESLPEEFGGSLIAKIQPKIREIEYLRHLDLGKKYFDANDWEAAIKQYEQALNLRDATPVATDDNTVSLYANMAEAELFALINSAKDAFSQSQWEAAIAKYQEAIDLLDSKRQLLERINPAEIQQQLERIILRARIVEFKQKADADMEKGAYAKAISSLEKVINAVVSSGLQKDKEFKAIINGTRQTISDTKGKAAISRRIDYLESNYKEIFEANYSAAVPEYLSEPKATFLRYEDGQELYEIQCLENNRGRKLRLVMLYSYNPATNKWQFFSENK